MQWEETNIGAKFSHYEVCLVEEDGRKTDIQKVMPDEERKARFKLLKSNTRYKACVTTIRKFATKHAEAFSETVQTKPGEMHSCNDSGCSNFSRGSTIDLQCFLNQKATYFKNKSAIFCIDRLYYYERNEVASS